ncbi:MAG: hypothetical protein F6K24_43355 [Okeania sp. SIO2D1]|uniref:hypothetical protein n=1 Tax=Okeania sp. SIO2C9 TaxID=2607791 RepID=UPI0013BDF284|nr:hypothetical protein [Okeania sp. SIO2C9]NEQ78264.1 hypothetical protein [Okeania sp. SIO2C9]NES71562.1 hypothetical protein [Okeania sp. SIO2D1]
MAAKFNSQVKQAMAEMAWSYILCPDSTITAKKVNLRKKRFPKFKCHYSSVEYSTSESFHLEERKSITLNFTDKLEIGNLKLKEILDWHLFSEANGDYCLFLIQADI